MITVELKTGGECRVCYATDGIADINLQPDDARGSATFRLCHKCRAELWTALGPRKAPALLDANVRLVLLTLALQRAEHRPYHFTINDTHVTAECAECQIVVRAPARSADGTFSLGAIGMVIAPAGGGRPTRHVDPFARCRSVR